MTELTRAGDDQSKLNILLYGLPGSYKTTLAATAAYHEDMRDVLIVAVEGGMMSVRELGLPPEIQPLIRRCGSVAEVEDVFWCIHGRSKGYENVRTVVLDSSTELGAKDIEATVGANLGKTSRSGKKREGIDDVWLDDRGEVSQRQARVHRWFRDLDVHFIATAHPRIVFPRSKDDVPQDHLPPKICEPGYGPRLRQHICGYMDFVWYLQPGDGCGWVLTQPTGPYYAKTRGRVAQRVGSRFQWHLLENGADPVLADVYNAVYHGVTLPDYTKERQDDTSK